MRLFEKLSLIVSIFVFVSFTFGLSLVSHAEETFGEKIVDKVDEVKKDAKISGRNAKRKARNVTCSDADRKAGKCGVGADLRDSAKNANDEITHQGKKLKNKVD